MRRGFKALAFCRHHVANEGDYYLKADPPR